MSISVPDFSEIQLKVQDAFTKTLGPSANFDAAGVLGQLVYNLSSIIQSDYQALQEAYSASRADQAQGQELDDLVALLNIKRSDGLKTVVKSCTLTGTDGTVIPQGSQASTTDGVIFESAVEATISGTTATVDFVSVDPGVFTVAVGALSTIVTTITGWTAITNPTVGVEGSDGQSDEALRSRVLKESQNMAFGYPGAIRAGIEGVDQVVQAYVYGNYTGNPSGPPFNAPAYSILCVVQYDDTSIEPAIAEAIFKRIPPVLTVSSPLGGAGNVKSEVVSITGNNITVAFTKALETPVNFVIDILQDTSFTQTDEQNIKDAITEYIKSNALIDGTLEYNTLVGVAYAAAQGVVIENFYMGTVATPGAPNKVSITANFYEVFVTGTFTIGYGS